MLQCARVVFEENYHVSSFTSLEVQALNLFGRQALLSPNGQWSSVEELTIYVLYMLQWSACLFICLFVCHEKWSLPQIALWDVFQDKFLQLNNVMYVQQ